MSSLFFQPYFGGSFQGGKLRKKSKRQKILKEEWNYHYLQIIVYLKIQIKMPKNVSKLMRKIINIFCYVMNIKISSDKQLTDIKAGSGGSRLLGVLGQISEFSVEKSKKTFGQKSAKCYNIKKGSEHKNAHLYGLLVGDK